MIKWAKKDQTLLSLLRLHLKKRGPLSIYSIYSATPDNHHYGKNNPGQGPHEKKI
jgi:hypothetical protein